MNADPESTPESTPEPRSEPLDAWHRRQAASWREEAGTRLVASYGDSRGEWTALKEACGLAERRWVEAFDVRGEDRVRFLNGYVTCDVTTLEPGSAAGGFFTTAQGRILADAVITAGSTALRVAVPAGRAQVLVDHLARYVLADRVEFELRPDVRQLVIAGPGAEELVADLVPELPATEGASAPARLADRDVEIQREWPLGVPVFVAWTTVDNAAVVAEELASKGAVPVGFDALETQRVLAGVPRYGADFDEARFPQETGRQDVISYTKGCYLGQEVVARIHYRGHVNHELRALRGEGGALPAAGATVELDGQEVGRLGSVALSPETGEAVGLAILHRKAAEKGSTVSVGASVGDGLSMTVEEPGFAVATLA